MGSERSMRKTHCNKEDEETGKITGSNGEFIHGTDKPDSVGKSQSKGCVRLNNADVENLAEWLMVGQYVLIKE